MENLDPPPKSENLDPPPKSENLDPPPPPEILAPPPTLVMPAQLGDIVLAGTSRHKR
jgi:hypothetical protein